MKTIDKRDAKRLLRKVVKGKEDYVYEPPNGGYSCKYQSKGKPSCLVGRVLFDIGVPANVLRGFDQCRFADIKTLIENGKLEHYIHITTGAAEVFSAAQGVQDAVTWVEYEHRINHAWGKALEAAEKV